MTVSRRELLKAGMSAAVLAAVPRPLLAHLGVKPEPVPSTEDPRVKALALRAVEAAIVAGAAYADVRLTHTRTRTFLPGFRNIGDAEQMVVGVRALVSGYWGFASGPVWSPDEMARLGREAAYQAETNASRQTRMVKLAPAPAVSDGHWVMPVASDPFEVSPFEIVDYLRSLTIFAESTPGLSVRNNECRFWVQEKAFASSEGSYCTQRLHRAQGVFVLRYQNTRGAVTGALEVLTPAGVGWELYREQPLRELIEKLMEELKEDLTLPIRPVEVGRYETICDRLTVARLLDQTLGRATELDRALGYEANAGGTSYLSDPLGMLATYRAGAPVVTVTGNRTERGGVATVRWDDEGVRPEEFTLVKDGVLTDFQTTRESAEWLADYYTKLTTPVRSRGCASAPSALEAPLQHTPNLALAPGREALDFEGLVAGVSRGIAVKEMQVDMDFQALNGYGRGRAYEVKQGKRVARLAGGGFLFRAPELWNGLLALGGAASVRRYGLESSKGEPAQEIYHSVTAPPAVFRQLSLIDALRKA